MSVTPARWAALDALRAAGRGELADRALARAMERVPANERPWTQELVYGTLRFRGRLDHLLGQRVRRGRSGLEPDVLDVLRLGAYQLLEMGSVPAYAAVSQAVEQAKRVGRAGAAGLVNGVLQRLARERDRLEYPDPDRDPVGHLVSWGSHPVWLVERWLRRYGRDEARALIEANNRRPELFVRVIGADPAGSIARLAAAGIAAEPVAWEPASLRIGGAASVRDVLALVPAVVQDPAASLVVRYAGAGAVPLAADLCAAPGGKAMGLATTARYVIATDASLARLELVRENARRLGLRVGVAVADARRPPIRAAPLVLLDVPCTGTGTLRRHPDGRWRIGPGDLASLLELQAELLDGAAAVVEPAGTLVYATCSLEPEENEEQVDSFLERHPEFEEAGAPADFVAPALDERGWLRVLPQRLGVDGAFAVRLRRRS